MDNRKFQSASSASPPAVEAAPSTGYPTDGNPSTATPATIPGARWFHQIGEELRNVIASAGLTPSDSNLTQLQQAIAALFAPIANPTFTGDPKAPTAPRFDNDTSLATTAFVKSAGLHYSATVAKSLPATLVAGDCGANIVLTGSGAVTLPSISSCPNGEALSIFNRTLSAVTINRAGADEIAVNGGAYVNSITLKPGDSIVLVSNSGSPWFAVGGTGANQFAGSFGSSLTTNGYQKLPSGLIIQWGQTGNIAANSSQAITFPIAFPVGVKSMAMANAYSASSATITASIGASFSGATTGFTAYNLGAANNNGAGWIALGW